MINRDAIWRLKSRRNKIKNPNKFLRRERKRRRQRSSTWKLLLLLQSLQFRSHQRPSSNNPNSIGSRQNLLRM